ncbi:MAG: TetR/AcrR family transcriptional regulator [Firmicutes bacterium]|nr:TetR/AcrR family transcriptional regulator [Bacillota bacterium]
MEKEGTKNMILEKASKLIHENGFNNTGIQEIIKNAGIPKGSFYYYFKSKEDFGLELIDFYASFILSRLEAHYRHDPLPYIKRLHNFFDEFLAVFESNDLKGGCPLGNLAQEMSDLNEYFRSRLTGVFEKVKDTIVKYLEQARKNGEISETIETEKTADFILNSWQGALLRAKMTKATKPLQLFDEIIFNNLL